MTLNQIDGRPVVGKPTAARRREECRVLFVLEAGDAWPSGWVRAMVYRELLIERGYSVTYVSRLWSWPIRIQWSRSRVLSRFLRGGLDWLLSAIANASALIREPWIVRKAKRYDIVFLGKVSSLPFIRRLRRKTTARLLYDLNDAVWLPSWRNRIDNIRAILRSVDVVTCDNPHGAAFARQYNARAFVVPDPPQVEMFDEYRADSPKRDGELVIGWIGSPSTLCNLYRIWEPLEQLFGKYPGLHLRLVGIGHDRWLLPRFEKVRWSATPHYTRNEMVREVLGMDIGLYPLFDVEDSLARGILKATVYMSGGVAVVASDVGQSRELICDGVNGMLATTSSDWFVKIEQLILDRSFRRAIAERGLATVRQDYSLARCFENLSDALNATQLGIAAGEQ